MILAEKQFFASDSGIVILCLIPICAAALAWYIKRIVARYDRMSDARDVQAARDTQTLTTVVGDLHNVVTKMTTLETSVSKHDEMIDKLSQIVTATNATMTAHLQWSQSEYTIMRAKERGVGQ